MPGTHVLYATQAENEKHRKPPLDAMQTWPDLTYRLGCQDEHTCPGGIIKIARIAQAAELGDPSPMKRWLDEFLAQTGSRSPFIEGQVSLQRRG